MVADYLESHNGTYMHTIDQSDYVNPYNTDSEAHNSEDAYIKSVTDPELESLLSL